MTEKVNNCYILCAANNIVFSSYQYQMMSSGSMLIRKNYAMIIFFYFEGTQFVTTFKHITETEYNN